MAKIIAECGLNHNGDLVVAKKMADAALKAGCNYAKFQTYQTDLRADSNSPIYNVLKKCELSYDDTRALKAYCDQIGIEFFSTPFDYFSLDALIEMGVRTIKIPSFFTGHHKFLRRINEHAQDYDLKVIMSCGMTNKEQIYDAIVSMKSVKDANLLHCVSSYPVKESDANLLAIRTLYEYFDHLPGMSAIGYSDHSVGYVVPSCSVFFGAKIIEKHFMVDEDCVDAAVSVGPSGMKRLVNQVKRYEAMIGSGALGVKDVERGAAGFRKETK